MTREKIRIKKCQEECARYIKATGNIPSAKLLAKIDEKTYSTSDWLGGLNMILKKK